MIEFKWDDSSFNVEDCINVLEEDKTKNWYFILFGFIRSYYRLSFKDIFYIIKFRPKLISTYNDDLELYGYIELDLKEKTLIKTNDLFIYILKSLLQE